jgi:outer membrane protein OmpA-like peptidoglycan-associated protein
MMKTVLSIIFLAAGSIADAQTEERFTINFDFDKYAITRRAKQKLDSFLSSTPAASVQKIDLYGHCDSIGNHSYNNWLSEKRVDAVKRYLLTNFSKNIFESLEGYGKRQPLNNNEGEYERLQNRRVEIIVQKKEASTTVTGIKKETPKTERSLTQIIKDTITRSGSNIILKNMNFYGGRHVLLPQSRPILTELLEVLKENPALEIEIQGHICCTPGREDGFDIDTRTYDLSVNRAQAIYEYLIRNGISSQRLSYKGFGHSRPLVYPEDTEERRTTNRRVEIKIIKK